MLTTVERKGKKGGDPRDVAIGQRIRAHRVAKGWSQEKLGDTLGVTFQQIQKYEKGTNRVGGSRIDAICAALGVTPNEIIVGSSQGQPGTGPSSLQQSIDRCTGALGSNAQEFYEGVAAMLPRRRHALIQLVVAIKEGVR